MSVSRETLMRGFTGVSPDSVADLFGVPRETLPRLHIFADLLLRWNRRINLISRMDESALWPRHIADSLQLLPHLPPTATEAADLGSGAGFPGLILAIATPLHVHLIESDARKASFLREAARLTQAQVTVHVTRIEAVSLKNMPLITARALAPLPKLLALATPLLAPDGILLFLKGAEADQELTDATATWNMSLRRYPSRIDQRGTILRISEVTRV